MPVTTSETILLGLPFVMQSGTMMADEFHFHRKRGLPLWERIGHPLDTLTVVLCYGFLLFSEPARQALFVFAGLALFSMLFTAKDEPVHRKLCCRAEHRTHLVLFALHPLVLGSAGILWWAETPACRLLLSAQAVLTALFMMYQVVYWNLLSRARGFAHAAANARDR